MKAVLAAIELAKQLRVSVSQVSRLAASLLKQTGNDALTARRPFERPFSFYPKFKLLALDE